MKLSSWLLVAALVPFAVLAVFLWVLVRTIRNDFDSERILHR